MLMTGAVRTPVPPVKRMPLVSRLFPLPRVMLIAEPAGEPEKVPVKSKPIEAPDPELLMSSTLCAPVESSVKTISAPVRAVPPESIKIPVLAIASFIST